MPRGRKPTYEKNSLTDAFQFIKLNIEIRKGKGQSTDQIIASCGGPLRQFVYPKELPTGTFTLYHLHPKDEANKRTTLDELFSRTTMIKCLTRAFLSGMSESEALKRIVHLCMNAYVTSEENQFLRDFQGGKSLKLQMAFIGNYDDFLAEVNQYLADYDAHLEEIRKQ